MKSNLIFSTVIFICWLLFATICSGYDWDLGYTILEIDLRTFWEKISFPTWSYQYCGGISRSGDVNSIAESPWFVLPVAFGAFWGYKLIAPLAFAVSIFYLNDFLMRYLNYTRKESYLFSGLFSLNSFWIMHVVHGHAGYSSQLLFIASMLHYFLFLKGGVTRDLFSGAVLLFSSVTLGFYHVGTYMGLPTAMGVIVALFILIVSGRISEINRRRVIQIMLCSLTAIVIYLPKILKSLNYQRAMPRSIETTIDESYKVFDFFISLFVPPVGPMRLLNGIRSSGKWAAHEYSYFSFLNLFVVMMISVILFKLLKPENRRTLKTWKPSLGFTLASCITVFSIIFYFGNFASFSPFGLLNKYVFNSSHRVSTRYLLVGLFFLNLGSFSYFLKTKHKLTMRLGIIGLLLGGVIPLTVITSEPKYLEKSKSDLTIQLEHENHFIDKMKYVVFTTQGYPAESYRLISNNFAVLNCYSPLRREIKLNSKFFKGLLKLYTPYFFFSHADGEEINENSTCYMESYFTQTEITISEQCPNEILLRLLDLNPRASLGNYSAKITEDGILLYKNGKSHE